MNNSASGDDAADMMQDGLLAIYQRAKETALVLTCPFEAYVYTVCRNLWLMQLRKTSRNPVTIMDVEQYITSAQMFLAKQIPLPIHTNAATCWSKNWGNSGRVAAN